MKPPECSPDQFLMAAQSGISKAPRFCAKQPQLSLRSCLCYLVKSELHMSHFQWLYTQTKQILSNHRHVKTTSRACPTINICIARAKFGNPFCYGKWSSRRSRLIVVEADHRQISDKSTLLARQYKKDKIQMALFRISWHDVRLD